MDRSVDLGMLGRYATWVAIVAVVLAAGAYLVSETLPRVYQSVALVQIVTGRQATEQASTPDETLQATNTYLQLARVTDVTDDAVKQGDLKGTRGADIAHTVTVAAQADVPLLTFTGRDHDAAIARDRANAYAKAFALFVGRHWDEGRNYRLSRVHQHEVEVYQALAATASQAPPLHTALQAELSSLENQAATIKAQPGDTAMVVQEGQLATDPSSPKPKTNGLLGAVVGAAVAAAGCYIHHLLTTRRLRSHPR